MPYNPSSRWSSQLWHTSRRVRCCSPRLLSSQFKVGDIQPRLSNKKSAPQTIRRSLHEHIKPTPGGGSQQRRRPPEGLCRAHQAARHQPDRHDGVVRLLFWCREVGRVLPFVELVPRAARHWPCGWWNCGTERSDG